jgi:signal transduction histidine kinase
MVGQALQDENRELRDEAQRLQNKVSVIVEVVSAQQRYAKGSWLLEPHSLNCTLDDVIELQAGLISGNRIQMTKDYRDEPQVLMERTKLIHVLVNLFKNAAEAMQETPIEKRQLVLVIDQEEGFGVLRITDTGTGIEPGILHRLFQYGFTTKADGHGFGLHSCQNYMNDMKGRISVESPGAGQGSTFVLHVPLVG